MDVFRALRRPVIRRLGARQAPPGQTVPGLPAASVTPHAAPVALISETRWSLSTASALVVMTARRPLRWAARRKSERPALSARRVATDLVMTTPDARASSSGCG